VAEPVIAIDDPRPDDVPALKQLDADLAAGT